MELSKKHKNTLIKKITKIIAITISIIAAVILGAKEPITIFPTLILITIYIFKNLRAESHASPICPKCKEYGVKLRTENNYHNCPICGKKL